MNIATVTPDFQKKQNKDAAFRSKLLMGAALGGGAIASNVQGASAQSIDVTTVSAQTASATTAITTVGATLLAMAFGLLVFTVATNVIRRVMGG